MHIQARSFRQCISGDWHYMYMMFKSIYIETNFFSIILFANLIEVQNKSHSFILYINIKFHGWYNGCCCCAIALYTGKFGVFIFDKRLMRCYWCIIFTYLFVLPRLIVRNARAAADDEIRFDVFFCKWNENYCITKSAHMYHCRCSEKGWWFIV